MSSERARSEVEQIVAEVRASRKYHGVCADMVHRVAADELARHGSLKSALKATKSKLHQVYAAYEAGVDYERAYRTLRTAYDEGSDHAIRTACRRVLSHHTSTRERLPILDRFYGEVFARTGVPHALLDLACGLNPLALPWMGLGKEAVYRAYDIDGERTAFLNRYFELAGCEARAYLQDVICDPPQERADVALVLKSATCLERQRTGSTLALVDELDVRWVVISFPVKSLGRREKGMPAHYASQFAETLSARPWHCGRLDLPAELVFLVDKR